MRIKIDGKSLNAKLVNKTDKNICEYLDSLPFGEVTTGKVLCENFNTNRAFLERFRFRNSGYFVPYLAFRGTLYGNKDTITALKKEMGM